MLTAEHVRTIISMDEAVWSIVIVAGELNFNLFIPARNQGIPSDDYSTTVNPPPSLQKKINKHNFVKLFFGIMGELVDDFFG